jgi:hypothetical protein
MQPILLSRRFDPHPAAEVGHPDSDKLRLSLVAQNEEAMILSVRLIVSVSFLLLSMSCRTEAVYNVEHAPLPRSGTMDQVKLDIERAAAVQGWRLEELDLGTFIATKRQSQHAASATVRYDEQTFSITLRHARNLKESGGKIHKTYNAWVRAFERSIRREAEER